MKRLPTIHISQTEGLVLKRVQGVKALRLIRPREMIDKQAERQKFQFWGDTRK